MSSAERRQKINDWLEVKFVWDPKETIFNTFRNTTHLTVNCNNDARRVARRHAKRYEWNVMLFVRIK